MPESTPDSTPESTPEDPRTENVQHADAAEPVWIGPGAAPAGAEGEPEPDWIGPSVQAPTTDTDARPDADTD